MGVIHEFVSASQLGFPRQWCLRVAELSKCHNFWFRSLRNKEPFQKGWVSIPHPFPSKSMLKNKIMATCFTHGWLFISQLYPHVKIHFQLWQIVGRDWESIWTLHANGSLFRNDRNQKLWHFYNSATRKYALPGPAPEMQINACNQRVARFLMKHTRGALITYAHTDVWEKWYRRTCNHTDRYTDRWEKWYRRTDCWWIKVIKLKPLNSQRSVRLYHFS